MFRLLLSKHYSYQLVRDISVIFSCHAFTNSRLHQSRQGRQHVDWWIHLGKIFTQSLSLCLLNELQNRCSLYTRKLIRLRHLPPFFTLPSHHLQRSSTRLLSYTLYPTQPTIRGSQQCMRIQFFSVGTLFAPILYFYRLFLRK